jgi:hypothetical protein
MNVRDQGMAHQDDVRKGSLAAAVVITFLIAGAAAVLGDGALGPDVAAIVASASSNHASAGD